MHLAPKTMPPFYLSCLTPFTSPRILMSDLVKVGLLGAGGFGAVELWEHKATHETYVSWWNKTLVLSGWRNGWKGMALWCLGQVIRIYFDENGPSFMINIELVVAWSRGPTWCLCE